MVSTYTGVETTRESGQTQEIGSTSGINAAIYFDIGMSRLFSITTGVNYIQKGLGIKGTAEVMPGQVMTYDASVKTNYILVPLLFTFNFDLDKARIHFGAGPYGAVTAGSHVRGHAEFNGESRDFNDLGGWNNSGNFDYGARGSIGMDFTISSTFSLLAGATYDYGLADVSSGVSNRTLAADLGLGIRL